MYYTKPTAFRTVAGPCGATNRPVATPEIDAVLPRIVHTLFSEEIEGVFLRSQRASWPKDDPVTRFVENDFDPERSGDAFLIPRKGVIMHWDPARGTGHGSHHEPDTHVPLIFLGGPFPAATRSDTATAPYDLAPTLAAVLGVDLPAATGRNLLAGATAVATPPR